jgi:CNT family concentrative nucleoside transporter
MLIAYLISENKKKISIKVVIWGVALQFIFAILILKTYLGKIVFDFAKITIDNIISFSDKGASFLFGKLVTDFNIGAIVAFKVLPIIIFVSSLSGILYYFGIIQFVVKWIAKIMHKTMKISGAESIICALFIFTGIESTTAVKVYIDKMTKSELFTMMSGFMATIATSVMATYTIFGAEAGHLLAASVMSAPAAIVIAKLMIPETGVPDTLGEVKFDFKSSDNNVIEAAANGAGDGLKLAVYVGAMLIAFISLIWLLDSVFLRFGTSFTIVMSYVFSPFAFIMGVPFKEILPVGELLATKTVFNEFLGYLKMKEMMDSGLLSQRSVIISTYALCGFSNFGSIAILIGGIGSLSPLRKKDVANLGIKALISGTLACFMTACIAGILI